MRSNSNGLQIIHYLPAPFLLREGMLVHVVVFLQGGHVGEAVRCGSRYDVVPVIDIVGVPDPSNLKALIIVLTLILAELELLVLQFALY